ncbi:uncharacterized protein LOC135815269 [Sycon ciliatum]|uniref:uncharacterized protein LOC135815269 n=1 Tax=Sycon ciliatum TaxID=27933 RepID=UPI0020A8DAAA|eukprot:scpid32682/ scgid16516/ 
MFRTCSRLVRHSLFLKTRNSSRSAVSLALRPVDIREVTCASELWKLVLERPDVTASSVASLLGHLKDLCTHVEGTANLKTSNSCAETSNSIDGVLEDERNIVRFAYGFYLPQMLDLLPHLDTSHSRLAPPSDELLDTSHSSVTSSADKSPHTGFVHELTRDLKSGVQRMPADGLGKELQGRIRAELIACTESYIVRECHTWPVDVISKALIVLSQVDGDHRSTYQALLSCPQNSIDSLADLVRKAKQPTWQCQVLKEECHNALRSLGDKALAVANMSAARTALVTLDNDKGAVMELPTEMLRELLVIKSPSKSDILTILCVLELAAKAKLVSTSSDNDLFNSLTEFVEHVSENNSLPASDCEEGLRYIAGIGQACAISFNVLIRDNLVRPLAFALVNCLFQDAQQLRMHTLFTVLRLVHSLRWNDRTIIPLLHGQILKMPSCQLDPTLMVNTCYFLANLCSLPKGVISAVVRDHWLNLHFDQQAKVVLTSAVVGEFLTAPWICLVDKMKEEEFNAQFRQFTAWCLAVLDAYVDLEFHKHRQQAALLPQSCGEAARNKCSSSLEWTAPGSWKFMKDLERELSSSVIWRKNPCSDFFFISGLAAIVFDDEGDFVCNDVEFDPLTMYPVYFVQGRMCPSGELDGMQKLLCRICYLKAAYCVHVKSGKVDDDIMDCVTSIQVFIISQESIEPPRCEIGQLVVGPNRASSQEAIAA